MSTGFAVTASTLFDACLRKLGVNIQGGSATSTQQTEMLLALNMMAKRFFTLGMPFYREYTHTIPTLVAGTPSYAISPDSSGTTSGVWNVYQAFLYKTSDNTEIPIRVISREEYHGYINKLDQARPTQVAIAADGKTAYLYMCPDSDTATNYTVKLYGYKQEDTYTAASDTLVFPMEWQEALLYGLCVRMCPEYGIALQQQSALEKMAESALQDAVNYNPQDTPSTYFGISPYGR